VKNSIGCVLVAIPQPRHQFIEEVLLGHRRILPRSQERFDQLAGQPAIYITGALPWGAQRENY
jgi:hypothetical protein